MNIPTLTSEWASVITGLINSAAIVVVALIPVIMAAQRKKVPTQRPQNGTPFRPTRRIIMPTALLIFDLLVIAIWAWFSLRLLAQPDPSNKDLALTLVAGVTMLMRSCNRFE